ncbi:Rne/Rng family ribonuclease [Candidatus Persebacteraceae bacterium Df01]|jgi:ribonuclease E|uniref:Ribonuclease G n=1 Tax=Candidatus Doriopsillibacter californiensis TaxID=2970740 RepID=A0ABT7QN60_9GAMM|nr:Rne/Rng family ribonuclease [Candidatus Persebacteraceae bacterium Df01]
MKQIYINTRQAEENRIIITEKGKLTGFEQDIAGSENKKGDIYKGVVTRVEESLDAVFVDFGEEKEGFLPFKHIAPNLLGASGGKNKVVEGDSILVQIKKDHVSGKGSGLTTYITLAGSYLVLRPNREARMLVSKQVDQQERKKALEAFKSLDLPEGMSVILRSAGQERGVEELRWDLESYLLKLWGAIEQAAAANDKPILIYRENNLLLRTVRDYFSPDKDEIHCDSPDDYNELKRFLSLLSVGGADNLYCHDGNGTMVPEEVEKQIDEIHERKVRTSSGAVVVFDSTEALVAIDVNSAQMRTSSDIEETALRSNMEAAETIALHLRLRDLAGLIVVDFIDMVNEKNRTKLGNYLAELLRKDRARVQWTSLSRFGLMEISRQRLSRPVEATQNLPCKACQGTGRQWRPEAFALRLLRQIRATTQKNEVSAAVVRAPEDTAIYLLNEKRVDLRRLEDESNCEIIIAPSEQMYAPDFNIRSIRDNRRLTDSYKSDTATGTDYADAAHERLLARGGSKLTKPLINTVMPETRAPSAKDDGFFTKLCKKLFSAGGEKKKLVVNDSAWKTEKNTSTKRSATNSNGKNTRSNNKNVAASKQGRKDSSTGMGSQKTAAAPTSEKSPEKRRSRRSSTRRNTASTVATITEEKADSVITDIAKKATTEIVAKKESNVTNNVNVAKKPEVDKEKITPVVVGAAEDVKVETTTKPVATAKKGAANSDKTMRSKITSKETPKVGASDKGTEKVWFEPEDDVDKSQLPTSGEENKREKAAVAVPPKKLAEPSNRTSVVKKAKSEVIKTSDEAFSTPNESRGGASPAVSLQMIESSGTAKEPVKITHNVKELPQSSALPSSTPAKEDTVMKQVESNVNQNVNSSTSVGD